MKKGKAWYRPVGIGLVIAGVVIFCLNIVADSHPQGDDLARGLRAVYPGLLAYGVYFIGKDRRQNWQTTGERKGYLAEHDERNIAIQEKAGQTAWNWTAVMLYGCYVFFTVRGKEEFARLLLILTGAHILFELINEVRWRRKL